MTISFVFYKMQKELRFPSLLYLWKYVGSEVFIFVKNTELYSNVFCIMIT